MVGGKAAGGTMLAFGVVVGAAVAGFQPGFVQLAKAAAVEQFRFEPAPKRLGGEVIVAVAAPTPALPGPVAGQ